MSDTRVCAACDVEKPLTEYHVHPKSRGGYRIRCKECVNGANRERHKTDAEWRARKAEYRRRNSEHLAAYRARPENRARAKAYNREYAAARRDDPEFQLGRSLWSNYRIRPERYYSMLAEQDGRCAICLTDEPGGQGRWHVDHDHGCCSGKKSCGACVRGLLCNSCNIGLGHFKDDVRRLDAALAYLSGNRP